MKIESWREVKAKLSKIVKELPAEKSVVITKNGRPCAVLFPVTERNGSRKHVTRPAKRFLAIAGPRTQGGGEERFHPT
jgi:prevent-host-death family protein